MEGVYEDTRKSQYLIFEIPTSFLQPKYSLKMIQRKLENCVSKSEITNKGGLGGFPIAYVVSLLWCCMGNNNYFCVYLNRQPNVHSIYFR